MSTEHAKNDVSPTWDNWPGKSTVGDCKISIFHSDETPPRALSMLAEPVSNEGHLGASIFCFLPAKVQSDVRVTPPLSAYWSSRRAGPSTKTYFSGPYPKLEVALLHALQDGEARSERGIAALYLLFAGLLGEVSLEEEDSFPNLVENEPRFRAIAEKWLETQSNTSEGLRRLRAAEKHVESAKKWYQSLEDSSALSPETQPEPGEPNLVQSAVYRSIRDAAVASGGVPLLCQVRESFREVGLRWDAEKSAHEISGKLPDLNLDRFDTAIAKLGFSWLPREWS